MPTTYTLRPAHSDEREMLSDLAQLDSAKPLHGDVVIAFDGDRPAVATSLHDGRIIADPFMLTADAIDLLHLYGRAPHRPPSAHAAATPHACRTGGDRLLIRGSRTSGPTRRRGRPARR